MFSNFVINHQQTNPVSIIPPFLIFLSHNNSIEIIFQFSSIFNAVADLAPALLNKWVSVHFQDTDSKDFSVVAIFPLFINSNPQDLMFL